MERPGLFAFASQPRALLGLPGVSPAPYVPFVARFAASHYRTFDNEPERSPYAAVSQLPAGSLVEVRNGVATRRRWWTLGELPDSEGSPDEWAERYSALLRDAVARRVAAAREPAFTLSGGLGDFILGPVVRGGGHRDPAARLFERLCRPHIR